MQVIPRAGHYAALEQPEAFADLLRGFLDGLLRS
jgi:pimeloyl-ACP methyl ester carboxylesterase